jgi:hypothetical protein
MSNKCHNPYFDIASHFCYSLFNYSLAVGESPTPIACVGQSSLTQLPPPPLASVARITQPSRADQFAGPPSAKKVTFTLASSCQKASSSNTSQGGHGEAEASSEPPPDDEPPLLTSGALGAPLYAPLFSATLVQLLHLFCFGRTAGAVGPHRRGRAAAGIAWRLQKKAAKNIDRPRSLCELFGGPGILSSPGTMIL